MQNRKVLVINDDEKEVRQFQTAISETCPSFSFEYARDPEEALSALMGGNSTILKSYASGHKVRPEIILLHDRFLTKNGPEFLDLIRKYYSLKNIRVFIIGGSGKGLDPALAKRYQLEGFLSTPHNIEVLLSDAATGAAGGMSVAAKSVFSTGFVGLTQKSQAVIQFFKGQTLWMESIRAVTAKFTVGATAAAFATVTLVAASDSSPAAKETFAEVKKAPEMEKMIPAETPPIETAEVLPVESVPVTLPSKKLETKKKPVVEPIAAAVEPEIETELQELLPAPPPARVLKIVAVAIQEEETK